ncbi:hypothetical protein L873DRAFT_1823935 [Choiromyces venosus 120613-1]|uniref:Uncharacterized protein n=1 Tax=Choiromyces venosus 120613-1 TaxID=1336337 RepID=A0A3N4J4Q9_9PEZI|nr:hypothetical protein L873DRAFT_1823935 [Choiromyces venosus 120613-1]
MTTTNTFSDKNKRFKHTATLAQTTVPKLRNKGWPPTLPGGEQCRVNNLFGFLNLVKSFTAIGQPGATS